MKTLNVITPIIVLVLYSCNAPKPETKTSATVKADTSAITNSREEMHAPNFYVNGIEYLPETNEFYVNLPFKKDAGYEMFEKLGKMVDSVVFQDEETMRERLPLEIAREYFDLTLLDKIAVYDYSNHFISNAKLVRVEYYRPPIESSFIAVFNPDIDSASRDKQYFCLSPFNKKLSDITTTTRANPVLTGRIMRDFNIKAVHEWTSRHTEILQDKSTLSILSVRVAGQDHPVSYLTQLKDGKLKIVNQYIDEYAFWDFLPLPVWHNGHPVLLVTIAIPETDVSPCYATFIWEKDGYKMMGNKFYLASP